MFRADLMRTETVEGPDGITLVYAHSSLYAALPFGGGGYSYSRPVAVRHEASGMETPIRDHVMTLRLGLIALALIAVMGRWIIGR